MSETAPAASEPSAPPALQPSSQPPAAEGHFVLDRATPLFGMESRAAVRDVPAFLDPAASRLQRLTVRCTLSGHTLPPCPDPSGCSDGHSTCARGLEDEYATQHDTLFAPMYLTFVFSGLLVAAAANALLVPFLLVSALALVSACWAVSRVRSTRSIPVSALRQRDVRLLASLEDELRRQQRAALACDSLVPAVTDSQVEAAVWDSATLLRDADTIRKKRSAGNLDAPGDVLMLVARARREVLERTAQASFEADRLEGLSAEVRSRSVDPDEAVAALVSRLDASAAQRSLEASTGLTPANGLMAGLIHSALREQPRLEA